MEIDDDVKSSDKHGVGAAVAWRVTCGEDVGPAVENTDGPNVGDVEGAIDGEEEEGEHDGLSVAVGAREEGCGA